MTVSNDVFSNNEGFNGGAIYNVGSTDIQNTIFEYNQTPFPGPYATPSVVPHGGAIDNLGILTVMNSSFIGNGAGEGGAISTGANYFPGSLTLNNDSFSGNQLFVSFGENYSPVGPNVYVDGPTTVNGVVQTSSF